MDPSGRAYEDFVPPHRMVREPPTHTLYVDLSAAGYTKEHIRVQLVHSHRRLIVRGERPVAGNRWNRFRLEFKLPDDCDAKGIQARFEKGVVRVTMPGAGMTPEATSTAQLEPASPAAKHLAEPAAAAFGGVQDGDRAAPAGTEELEKDQEKTKAQKQKQESGRQRVSSFRGDDASTEGGDATPMAAAVPSSRQGHAFLRGRKKMGTTVLGVVLALISLGIYVRYSFAP